MSNSEKCKIIKKNQILRSLDIFGGCDFRGVEAEKFVYLSNNEGQNLSLEKAGELPLQELWMFIMSMTELYVKKLGG